MFVATNRLKVQKGRGHELEERFQHSGAVAREPGFLGFELWGLASESEHDEYLVVSHWESEKAHAQWTRSESFQRTHSGPPADFFVAPGEFQSWQVLQDVRPEA